MTTEENKALIRRFITAQHAGDLALLDELLGVTFKLHLPGMPSALDRENTKQFFAMFHQAFPDSMPQIEDQVAEGDLVATRVTVQGTHRGTFQGVPPTGKAVTIAGIGIHRVVNGQVVEHWPQPDLLGLMQQLGVIPAPSPT